MKKVLTIDNCSQCYHFDNGMYNDLSPKCTQLNRQIEEKNGIYEIPNDCVLKGKAEMHATENDEFTIGNWSKSIEDKYFHEIIVRDRDSLTLFQDAKVKFRFEMEDKYKLKENNNEN